MYNSYNCSYGLLTLSFKRVLQLTHVVKTPKKTQRKNKETVHRVASYITLIASLKPFVRKISKHTIEKEYNCCFKTTSVATAHNNTHVNYPSKRSQDFLLVVFTHRIIFFMNARVP
jgi:hypothetical protein